MLRLLRRAINFFRRRVDSTQEQQAEFPKGDSHLKTKKGVVTSFYGDYGLINGSIYFSYHVVTARVPVKVGQKVAVLVEEDPVTRRCKAIKVDILCDDTDNSGPSEPETRILTACVTFVSTEAVYISKKTCFSLDIVSEGFIPFKGDWLAVEYSLLPGTSNIVAHSVKPMACRHVEKVRITNLYGRNGVIDNEIFFTKDSLNIPDGYTPQMGDLVNVVMVESVQFCYVWRAISIIPV